MSPGEPVGSASQSASGAKYRRVLLKLSGEAFADSGTYGINAQAIHALASQIIEAAALGVEIAIVVGGGNIWRGTEGASWGMDRARADYMGMLATVLNALALQDALEHSGGETRVLTAISMQEVAEPFIRGRAIRHLQKGRVVIFGAGTGNPYFSTDTAAAVRALEIGADALLKGTRVEGVYDADPEVKSGARLYRRLSYMEVLSKGLKVMDSAAISLCMDHELPIIVFRYGEAGNIKRAVLGEPVGTLVHKGPSEFH